MGASGGVRIPVKRSGGADTGYMRILLSNDDGCQASGLRCLWQAMKPLAEVDVVAPDRNRSGASNSLTLARPLRVRHEESGAYCVDGTPTDCVHLALSGLLDEAPDMVLSGINAGANLGDDVLYSGTVAAAMEGRSLGYPAIAVSTVAAEPQHYQTAARVAVVLIERLGHTPLPADTILNVNVPDVPWAALEGFESTTLGNRHRAERVIRDEDPRGRRIYWIGPAGDERDGGPGTDFHAVRHNRVSITPIHTDLTHYATVDTLGTWLAGL